MMAGVVRLAGTVSAVILAGLLVVVVWWMATWGVDANTELGSVEPWAIAVRILLAAGAVLTCVVGLRRLWGAGRGRAVAVMPVAVIVLLAGCCWLLWALFMIATDPH